MEEGVVYADLRLPPTPGNGPPTLSVGSLPSCSPSYSPEMSSQTCSPHSLSLDVLSLWMSSLKQLLSSPVADCLLSGRRGSRAGNAHCSPMPQHKHFTSLLSPASIACREMISRTIKLLQMGSPRLFPGSPLPPDIPPGIYRRFLSQGFPLLPPSPLHPSLC